MTSTLSRTGSRALGTALILTVQLMLILDMTVVNVALPDIRTGLGFTPSALSWVLNAYTLAFGGLLLLGGRLGDVFGRRRTFHGRPGRLHPRLPRRRPGPHRRLPRRRPRPPGRRRGGRRAQRAGPAEHLGPRRDGPHQGAGAVQRRLLGRRLARAAARWPPHRLRLVALVAVHQRARSACSSCCWCRRHVAETERQRGHFDVLGAVTATLGSAALVFGFIHAPDNGWTAPGTLAAFAVAARPAGHPGRPRATHVPRRCSRPRCCAAAPGSARSR